MPFYVKRFALLILLISLKGQISFWEEKETGRWYIRSPTHPFRRTIRWFNRIEKTIWRENRSNSSEEKIKSRLTSSIPLIAYKIIVVNHCRIPQALERQTKHFRHEKRRTRTIFVIRTAIGSELSVGILSTIWDSKGLLSYEYKWT